MSLRKVRLGALPCLTATSAALDVGRHFRHCLSEGVCLLAKKDVLKNSTTCKTKGIRYEKNVCSPRRSSFLLLPAI